MVGGKEEAYIRAKPLLQAFSSKVELMGDAGAGQYSKATNQIMLTMNMLGVCEGLVFGHKAGLDLERLISLIGGGGAGSFMLEKYGPQQLKRNFAAGFYVEHLTKDLGIVLQEAEKM